MAALLEEVQPEAAAVAPPSVSVRRRVLTLATPVIGENLLQTIIGIVDTLFVGRLGADALAGVGTAIQVVFFLISSLTAVAIGSSIMVAQAVGGQQFAHANRVVRQSIVWSLLLAVPLTTAGTVLAYPLVGLFGATPAVTRIAGAYLQITLGTLLLLILNLACSAVLRGAGDTRTPMFATLLANVVNAVAAWALIFGGLGLPALGPNGSAWAASLGRAVAAALLLAMLWRGRAGISIRGRADWRPRWDIARRSLGLGIPAAFEQLLISAGFTAFTILIVRLGTDALAAQRVAGNAMSLSLLPGIGFSIAATALVGQSIGAGKSREGEAAAYEAMRLAILWMTGVAVLYFIGGAWIMRAFSGDPTIVAIGASSLKAIAFSQPSWAVIFVLTGALRGAGDTRFPMVVNASGIWASVLLGWVAVSVLGLDLTAAWACFALCAPVALLVVVRRFRGGEWQRARV